MGWVCYLVNIAIIVTLWLTWSIIRSNPHLCTLVFEVDVINIASLYSNLVYT